MSKQLHDMTQKDEAVERITFDDLWHIMHRYNVEHPDREEYADLTGVIVYKASNWKTEYPLGARSYEVCNNNRAFQPGKIANSIFGYALDGSDPGVRLDWYNWEVDYCYMKK